MKPLIYLFFIILSVVIIVYNSWALNSLEKVTIDIANIAGNNDILLSAPTKHLSQSQFNLLYFYSDNNRIDDEYFETRQRIPPYIYCNFFAIDTSQKLLVFNYDLNYLTEASYSGFESYSSGGDGELAFCFTPKDSFYQSNSNCIVLSQNSEKFLDKSIKILSVDTSEIIEILSSKYDLENNLFVIHGTSYCVKFDTVIYCGLTLQKRSESDCNDFNEEGQFKSYFVQIIDKNVIELLSFENDLGFHNLFLIPIFKDNKPVFIAEWFWGYSVKFTSLLFSENGIFKETSDNFILIKK